MAWRRASAGRWTRNIVTSISVPSRAMVSRTTTEPDFGGDVFDELLVLRELLGDPPEIILFGFALTVWLAGLVSGDGAGCAAACESAGGRCCCPPASGEGCRGWALLWRRRCLRALRRKAVAALGGGGGARASENPGHERRRRRVQGRQGLLQFQLAVAAAAAARRRPAAAPVPASEVRASAVLLPRVPVAGSLAGSWSRVGAATMSGRGGSSGLAARVGRQGARWCETQPRGRRGRRARRRAAAAERPAAGQPRPLAGAGSRAALRIGTSTVNSMACSAASAWHGAIPTGTPVPPRHAAAPPSPRLRATCG